MSKKHDYVIPTPTQVLPELWEKGIFKTERACADVAVQFAEMEYNFTPQAVDMALKRAPFLTQRGKKGSYTYIQKGPFKKA